SCPDTRRPSSRARSSASSSRTIDCGVPAPAKTAWSTTPIDMACVRVCMSGRARDFHWGVRDPPTARKPATRGRSTRSSARKGMVSTSPRRSAARSFSTIAASALGPSRKSTSDFSRASMVRVMIGVLKTTPSDSSSACRGCNIGQMKKVAAYVRISMDATGERWGVETQRRKIAELCSARDWKIFDWYEDNDVSATKPRGPKSDWARMLVDAAAGLFELVVAVDIARLLRSTRDMNTLMDTGINVATVDGEIDLSTADGEVRAGFLALMARFETRRKSERQLRSNERRRAEGMPASAWPSLGWTKDGKVVPEQAAAVRRAFDAFLGEPSLSIRRIREDLNADGHRTARGSEFSTDAVRYLLGNSLYAGYIKKYSTGELFPVQGNAFQPIVSEQTWRAAVAKLEDNVRRAARQGNQPKYLLSSVGLCGKCGATLVSGTNSRGVGTYKC